jgi:hypothetical protein
MVLRRQLKEEIVAQETPKSEEVSETTDDAGNDPGGLTPDEKKLADDKKLASENRAWRQKTRALETTVKDLTAKIEGLAQKPTKDEKDGSAPDDKSKEDLAAEIAKLRRETQSLKEENAKRADREATLEKQNQEKTVGSALAMLIAEGKFLEPSAARTLLKQNLKIADDGTPVFMVPDPDVDGETKEVEATPENVKKYGLLPKSFIPTEGSPGGGSRAPKSAAASRLVNGIDMSRVLAGDTKYYLDHKAEVDAIRREQKGQ